MKKNKILIAGCDGYIGSELCDKLYRLNYSFEGLDNGMYKKCKLFKRKKKYKIHNIDIRDVKESFIKKFDTYIHLPALTNNPVDDLNPKKLYDVTKRYTERVAKICKKNNVKFIYPSSCSVYGETAGNKLYSEKSKLNPISYYSKNKVEIEKILKKLSNKKWKPIILRISTLFGISEKMRFDLALNMFMGSAITTKKILLNSDGTAWRPHVHLDDVIEAFICSINYKNKKIEIINVGSNKNNYRMIDTVNIIKKIHRETKIEFLNPQKKGNIFHDKLVKYGKDKRNYQVSFNKINKIFKNKIHFKPISKSLKSDYDSLSKIKLRSSIFMNKKFYRLHWLEKMIKIKKVSNLNLRVSN